jgi:iron complex outermembrane receptor protein
MLPFKIQKSLSCNTDTPGINVVGYEGSYRKYNSKSSSRFCSNSFYVYEQAYDVAGKPIDGVYIDRDMDGSITEKR